MNTDQCDRRQFTITGVVQGVGFRPFVYRLAQDCQLTGWVANNAGGVYIEVQGMAKNLEQFARRLQREPPLPSRIDSLTSARIRPQSEPGFVIRESMASGQVTGTVMPDLAPCSECLRELLDPADRRYRYPFINCTQCGPRYSISEGLPYDRANTAMRHFTLCKSCLREYEDPLDRRFHAEPNACPECGPQLALCDGNGTAIAAGEEALERAVADISAGKIVALKGVGGFQLLVDATSTDAVLQLRNRKHRPHKPFAMLFPNLAMARQCCELSQLEERLLCAPERPILLVPQRQQAQLALSPQVAPNNPDLGVMLPASPLHHLLMAALQRPVVATSGNLSGEPICTQNSDALRRLDSIADHFLVHDRPIARPLDDSVLRVMDGMPVILRRARGYAPLPHTLAESVPASDDLIALGADLKSSAALSRNSTVFISQHLGDLGSPAALDVFEQTIGDFQAMYQATPKHLLCDAHPGYVSSRWGSKRGTNTVPVQHHTAHFFSCMAEHGHRQSALGICWDGTGHGTDGTVWGGEFLHWDGGAQIRRFASLKSFTLPGGEQAVRDPRRCAAGLLYELFGEEALRRPILRNSFRPDEVGHLTRMMETGLNSPRCTSAGRLFDGVAVLLGLCNAVTYEGQAAMTLEYAARGATGRGHYPFRLIQDHERWVLDWQPTIIAMMEEGARGVTVADRAARFHNTLVEMMVTVAEKAGEEHVFLSGGVFQNRRLTETAATQLRTRGFKVHCHSSVPPNDGGIALGQIYYARCMAAIGALPEKGGSVCV